MAVIDGQTYIGSELVGVSPSDLASVQALLDTANSTITSLEADIVTKDADIAEKTYPFPASMFMHNSDHRDFPNGDPDEATLDWLINNINPSLLYYQYDYYPHMDEFTGTILEKWWTVKGYYRFLRYSDTTNVTSFPEIPAGLTPRCRYLYIDYSYSNGPSWNDAGVNDIPTSRRQMWATDRLHFQRNEFTSDKQLGIIAGIERELLAGMGSTTAGGTTMQTDVFYIYFNSTSTGRNDSIPTGALEHTALLADGWVQSGSTRLIKTVGTRTVYLYYIP